MADRRRDLRALVRLEVEPGGPGLKRPPFYVTHNISVSGMFLVTTDPLPENTRLKLQFQIPGVKDKIRVTGEVTWCREHEERPPFFPGMGIRFLEITEKDRGCIEQFVREFLEDGKPTGNPSGSQEG